MAQVLTPEILQEIVRRVVAVAHPQQIVLFGSAAQGKMGPHSDVDLLVVVEETPHRRRLAQTIYRNLVGVGFATDIVVATTDDLKQYGKNPGLVIQPALEEGKVIYAA